MSHEGNNQASNLGSVSVWLRQVPLGDREAQNCLLERYRQQVLRYARYRLIRMGVRSKDADDIAQEVFMGLFKRAEAGNLPNLDTRDKLWGKLCQITRDRVIDARRKKLPFTESAVNAKDASEVLPGMPQVVDEQLDECLLLVENEFVRRKLADRHKDLPKIVRLKIMGYRPGEIANQLDVPKRTVERRLEWINAIFDEYAMQDI